MKERIRRTLSKFEDWLVAKVVNIGNSIIEKERLRSQSLDSRKRIVFEKLCKSKIPGFVKALKRTIMTASHELWIDAKPIVGYASRIGPVTYSRGCPVNFLPVRTMDTFTYADCLDACLKASEWNDVCWQVPKNSFQH